MADTHEETVDVFALANRLEMTPAQIYRHVQNGALNPTKGADGTAFTEPDIQAFLDQRESSEKTLVAEIDAWQAMLCSEAGPAGDATSDPDDHTATAPGGASGSGEALAAEETLDQKQDRLVDALLAHALNAGALDVYLDPVDKGARVLFRLAGEMRRIQRLSPTLRDAFFAKVKSRFGVSESVSEPRSGMFAVPHGERTVQVRGTVAPTVLGEHIHLMLRDAVRPGCLAETGLSAVQEEALREALDGKPGVFLTVGPVDPVIDQYRSTLASMLAAGNRLVVSLEHRAHIKSEVLVQLRVSKDEPANFAAMFQVALAMSPQVLFIDSVGGVEEALPLAEAAAAGIAVVAHLRAADNVDALLRLSEYGLSKSMLARDLIGLSSQRLVRRVCRVCRTWRRLTAEEATQLALEADAEVAVAHGCEACSDGFSGRRAFHDLWLASPGLRTLIRTLDPPAEALDAWGREQSLSLRHAVRAAVLAGEVLLEDVAALV